ncbi:MAG: hypothetical protein R3C28_14410 [Pirellulaceae bacterium]
MSRSRLTGNTWSPELLKASIRIRPCFSSLYNTDGTLIFPSGPPD